MEDRYQRQMMLQEIGEEGQRKLHDARVLIVGAGGLGSPVSLYLAGAGVGTIGLIDDDVVSRSNLHRQVLYDESQIGQPKVECAAARLHAMNPELQISAMRCRLTAENAAELISGYDLVMDCSDNFGTRFAISDACCILGIPFVHGAILGLEGQVSVLNKGRCSYRTLFPDEQQTLRMPHPGKQVLGVTAGIVGCMQANQAIQLICGFGEPLVDRLWTIDLRTLQTFIIDL